MAVLRRGVKNATRNLIRTISITAILALVVALAVVMLLSRQAVSGRIAEVKGEVGTTITVTPAGSRGFAGGGEPLTVEQIATVTGTDHVVAVAQTLTDRVRTAGSDSAFAGPGGSSTNATTSLQSSIDAGSLGQRFGADGQNGQTFSVPISVTGTTDPDSTLVAGVQSMTLTAGSTIDGTGNAREALVGATLATKNNLSAGSTFTLYDQTLTVVGVFDAANTFVNGSVIVPLATLQELSGQAGAVTSVLAKVDSIDAVSSTTSALKAELGGAADVVSDESTAAATISSLDNVRTISSYSMVGALVAGAVILFLSMLMIVRERRREIGVLKAIGASNGSISLQFMAEALTVTLLAGLVGLALSVVLSNPVLDVMVKSNDQTTQVAQQQGRPFGGGGFAAQPQQGAAPGRTANPTGNGGGFQPGSLGRGVTRFSTALSGLQTSVGGATFLYGLLIAIGIAVVGSAVPSYLIARVRPAEVMRSE